eukprot:9499593-Pyramimonas_sp.AAC.1
MRLAETSGCVDADATGKASGHSEYGSSGASSRMWTRCILGAALGLPLGSSGAVLEPSWRPPEAAWGP